MKICPKCGIEHKKSGKFCSRSCANSRERSPELREKLSNALKGRIPSHSTKGKFRVERVSKICPECNGTFVDTVTSSKKYCCAVCAKKNAGGYRAGSGRAKTGYYKGIYCGSTYELCWLIYQLDHNLDVSRFEGVLEFNDVKYIPDFLQDGKIIEIKGYERHESVEKKSAVAAHLGYDVIVLRKENLEHCFKWVRENYNVNKFYELYDNYKPIYSYACSYCNTEFNTDRKRNTEHVYCSRSCSLKGTARLYRADKTRKDFNK